MSNIAISYRRDDVPAEARRIRDSLAARTGDASVALIEPGAAPRPEPAAGDVLIAIFGPRWMDAMRGHASRGERDEVRADIAAALRRGQPIVPVRVGRTDALPPLPRPQDLPDELRGLGLMNWRTITADRLELDTVALGDLLRPASVVAMREPLPGNSSFKLGLFAAGVIAATVLFANLLGYFMGATGASRPAFTQAPGQGRISQTIANWTGEGRIRRAIEAALAKGRRPEEAQRCQSQLIAATDNGIILFATGSADLDLRSHQTLDTLAQIIKSCPDFVIEVEGHTDNVGDPPANQRLSERRANSVRDYLIRGGVPAAALTASGLGDTRPVTPNDTPANMARNRRIEFNITSR